MPCEIVMQVGLGFVQIRGYSFLRSNQTECNHFEYTPVI